MLGAKSFGAALLIGAGIIAAPAAHIVATEHHDVVNTATETQLWDQLIQDVFSGTTYGVGSDGLTQGGETPGLINLNGYVDSPVYQQLLTDQTQSLATLENFFTGPNSLFYSIDQDLSKLFTGPDTMNWTQAGDAWASVLNTLLNDAATGNYSNIDPNTLFQPLLTDMQGLFSAFETDATVWYDGLTGSNFPVPPVGDVMGPDGTWVPAAEFDPSAAAVDPSLFDISHLF